MPTVVNSLDGEEKLVTDANAVKSVTCKYWSKLYKQQEVPNVPKPWLVTALVTEVQERVLLEPFEWPVPALVADFQVILRKGNH